MVIGIPNPNVVMPLAKMKIVNTETSKIYTVMYNPQSYILQRQNAVKSRPIVRSNYPMIQQVGTQGHYLKVQLFFDSFSSGAEVGGNAGDRALMGANSIVPSPAKMSVTDRIDEIYKLMYVDPKLHRPPELMVSWGTLIFPCYLIGASVNCTKFNEMGKPVRAVMDCQFIERDSGTGARGFYLYPFESPDTTKYKRVKEGDSLWAYADKEYGDCSEWRRIADANGIVNPRLLKSGELINIPAI